MKRHIHNTLFGLSIFWFTLSCFGASANIPPTETPVAKYHYYDGWNDPKGWVYHAFLPSKPSGLFYYTKVKASGNIDDTSEEETVVLMLVDTESVRGTAFVQAYLLIAENKAAGEKKKDFFKLFDSGTYKLEVPAKSIQLHNPPFVFTKIPENLPMPYYGGISVELIDLTGDGILDVWVEFAYGVVVISFQNGEFKKIFSSYTVPMDQTPEYLDLDNDGIYEIKIPYKIYIDNIERASYPTWMSLYDWDGTAYVLDNQKFYSHDDDIYVQLLLEYNDRLIRERELAQYNHPLIQRGELPNYLEMYQFYIGLVHYYRSELYRAQYYLQDLAIEAKNQDYRNAADAMLTELWKKINDPKGFERSYRSDLIRQYGDIPEVHIFLAGKKKLMSGSFRFPADEDEFLRFYEAKYVLWPDKIVLSELQKVRKAKADGTHFQNSGKR